MKKTILFLLATLAIIINMACNDDDDPKFETKDFEATFFTNLISIGEDLTLCSPPHNFLNVQEGNGSETLVGDFTTTITFCVNPVTLEYVNSESSFVDVNGDSLFIDVNGQVLPSSEPGYDLEFEDPFAIIGGTGRFEEASGSGMTKSYVNQTTGRTDHTWTGTITLKK